MTSILSATIKNFLSIGNIAQTINLSRQGLTIILGENIDIGDADSRNGVGKSTVLQAISYGLYGEPLNKIRLDNCINNINNKAMLVKIELESDGKLYTIERGRKPSVLRLIVDGAEFGKTNEAQGENRHTQTEIDRIIGMSHMMFKHVVGLSTDTTPFMSLKAAEQREVIEELLGITQLSQRAASLKELMDTTKEQLRDEESRIKANNEANARIEQAIERAKADAEIWQTAHNRTTDNMILRSEELNKIDIDAEISIFVKIDEWLLQQKEIDDLTTYARDQIEKLAAEIHRLEKEIKRYEEEAARVDNGEIARLEAQMKRYVAESEENIDSQLNRLTTEATRRRTEAKAKIAEGEQLAVELQAIQDQLDSPNAHTCSTCGQGLIGTGHLELVMESLNIQYKKICDKIEKAMADSDQRNEDAASIDTEIVQAKETHVIKKDEAAAKAKAIRQDIEIARTVLDQQKETAANRVIELRDMLADVYIKVEENQSIVDEGSKVIDAIGAKPRSTYPSRESVWKVQSERDVLLSQIETELAKPNVHLSKIEGLESTLVVVDYDPINEYNLRLKHEAFLYKLLTAKDSFIRKKIVDQNLMYLNNRMNHYLDRIKLPHEVAFMPDLTVEVNLLGRELDFEQLSKGEKNRVIMATFWSFRDVWESLNNTFNLIFCDEILDSGMDNSGAEAALAVLQSMARDRKKSVFVISHKENLIDKADRVMLIRKEDHFTTIEADYELV